LSFKSSGYLKKLTIDEGDSFTKGQLLAQFGLIAGSVSKVPAITDEQNHLFTIEILLDDLKVNQVAVGQLVYVLTDVITYTLTYRLSLIA
jgi:multidrug efflux system membrane fusion protein